jgi:hypothetical protein
VYDEQVDRCYTKQAPFIEHPCKGWYCKEIHAQPNAIESVCMIEHFQYNVCWRWHTIYLSCIDHEAEVYNEPDVYESDRGCMQ